MPYSLPSILNQSSFLSLSSNTLFLLLLLLFGSVYSNSQLFYKFQQAGSSRQSTLYFSQQTPLPYDYARQGQQHFCHVKATQKFSLLCCPDRGVFMKGSSRYGRIASMNFNNNQLPSSATSLPSPCATHSFLNDHYLFTADLQNKRVLKLKLTENAEPNSQNSPEEIKLTLRGELALIALDSIGGMPLLLVKQNDNGEIKYELLVGSEIVDIFFHLPIGISISEYYRVYVMMQEQNKPTPAQLKLLQYSSASGQVKFFYEGEQITSPLCAEHFSAAGSTYIVFTCSKNTNAGGNSNAGQLRIYPIDTINEDGLICSYKKPAGSPPLSISAIQIYENAFLSTDLIFVMERESSSKTRIFFFKIYKDKADPSQRYCEIEMPYEDSGLITAGIFNDQGTILLQYVTSSEVKEAHLCGGDFFYNAATRNCEYCMGNVNSNNQRYSKILQETKDTCYQKCPDSTVTTLDFHARAICDYKNCINYPAFGPYCQKCEEYRGYPLSQNGLIISPSTCLITRCPPGQHVKNGICMPNEVYYRLVDGCYNVKINSLEDCGQCVHHGCRLYQNFICSDFNSEAVQRWQNETLFTTHPNQEYCPDSGAKCYDYRSADKDSKNVQIFARKPDYVGFQCSFIVDSRTKDFDIKLYRGKNSNSERFNERIYVIVYDGAGRVTYYSNEELQSDMNKIHVKNDGHAEVHYLKISNEANDSVLRMSVDAQLLADEIKLLLILLFSALFLICLIILLVLCIRCRDKKKRAQKYPTSKDTVVAGVIDQNGQLKSTALIIKPPNTDDHQRLAHVWSQAQDKVYRNNCKQGCTMKSDAFYIAQRQEKRYVQSNIQLLGRKLQKDSLPSMFDSRCLDQIHTKGQSMSLMSTGERRHPTRISHPSQMHSGVTLPQDGEEIRSIEGLSSIKSNYEGHAVPTRPTTTPVGMRISRDGRPPRPKKRKQSIEPGDVPDTEPQPKRRVHVRMEKAARRYDEEV